jgi:hypothetical protein
MGVIGRIGLIPLTERYQGLRIVERLCPESGSMLPAKSSQSGRKVTTGITLYSKDEKL